MNYTDNEFYKIKNFIDSKPSIIDKMLSYADLSDYKISNWNIFSISKENKSFEVKVFLKVNKTSNVVFPYLKTITFNDYLDYLSFTQSDYFRSLVDIPNDLDLETLLRDAANLIDIMTYELGQDWNPNRLDDKLRQYLIKLKL